jgi:hypothetical protein
MDVALLHGRQGQIVGAVHRHRGRALPPLHPLTFPLELLQGVGKRQSLSLAGPGLRLLERRLPLLAPPRRLRRPGRQAGHQGTGGGNRSQPGEERRGRLTGEVGVQLEYPTGRATLVQDLFQKQGHTTFARFEAPHQQGNPRHQPWSCLAMGRGRRQGAAGGLAATGATSRCR